jgi:hypothetical protein
VDEEFQGLLAAEPDGFLSAGNEITDFSRTWIGLPPPVLSRIRNSALFPGSYFSLEIEAEIL